MAPVPWPNLAPLVASMAGPKPSSRQTTAASLVSHPLSQTVPQKPLANISRRPSFGIWPLTRRTICNEKETALLGRQSFIWPNLKNLLNRSNVTECPYLSGKRFISTVCIIIYRPHARWPTRPAMVNFLWRVHETNIAVCLQLSLKGSTRAIKSESPIHCVPFYICFCMPSQVHLWQQNKSNIWDLELVPAPIYTWNRTDDTCIVLMTTGMLTKHAVIAVW